MSKPRFTFGLWMLIESLGILMYAAKSGSTLRKAIGTLNLVIIAYAILCTDIIVQIMGNRVPAHEMGLGFFFGWFFFLVFAETFLLDSQRELKPKPPSRINGSSHIHSYSVQGTKAKANMALTKATVPVPKLARVVDVSKLSFRKRVAWAIKVRTNPTGFGWTHEPPHYTKSFPSPPYANHTRLQFIQTHLKICIINLILFHLNGIFMHSNPYYGASLFPEHVVGYQRLWRVMAFMHAFDVITTMTFTHAFAGLVVVALGISEPKDWAPPFGKLSEGYTLGRFWGVVWHQFLRRTLVAYANALTRLLRLPPNHPISRVVKLFTVFLISGLIHYISNYTLWKTWDYPGVVVFFLLQPVGILLEEGVMHIWSRATRSGSNNENPSSSPSSTLASSSLRKSPRWTYFAGYVWTAVWCALTLPFWMDDHARFGYDTIYKRGRIADTLSVWYSARGGIVA